MRFESVTIAAVEKSTLQSATSYEQARLQGAAVLPREAGAALQCAMLCVAVSPEAARAPPITPAIWRGGVSAPHYVDPTGLELHEPEATDIVISFESLH